MHSEEVDFPKTGEHVILPKSHMPKEYPFFMELNSLTYVLHLFFNHHLTLPSCESDKVISQLYNQVKSLDGQAPLPELTVEMDIELVVPGHEKYGGYAHSMYTEYVTDFLGIMRLFGVRTEVMWRGCNHSILLLIKFFLGRISDWGITLCAFSHRSIEG
jgi:RNA dependent RNA polymerase